jgi:hypothetical protein
VSANRLAESAMTESVLVIACGALARELNLLRHKNRWPHVEIRCLPAELHNRPEKIAPEVEKLIEAERDRHAAIFVAYADCGTGGALDRLLGEHGIERLPGAHCYEFFAGSDAFHALAEEEPGTFYLTDFLVRSFGRLVWRGLGLDRHPELRDAYFGNYRRVVLLSQSDDPAVEAAGRKAAEMLGLEFEHLHVGREPFAAAVAVSVQRRVA